MPSPRETAAFVREVRRFAIRTPEVAEAIRYFTLPDERHDLTLVAERVYGDRGEYLTIWAAAGLDTVEQPLAEQRLVLPTPRLLIAIKRQTGYLTDAEARTFDTLR
ncbi:MULTISPECIES: hypothetical protein [Burkholderia cepacia complex]|jgi:hypothetical protein|uniref:hypothetical protein n=1 Tax=Burkholderia cepacia complex TaxID=87882 RepID=UPI001589061C|nr:MULTISPECIES: hypothetical protein [Burkholderia cepacia complex]MCA8037050.1 hypothetical protein [Burkholderia arboris]